MRDMSLRDEFNFYMENHDLYIKYWRKKRKTAFLINVSMIVTGLVIGIIISIFTYKSTIIDPIENMKKLFINSNIIIIGILLAATLISNLFSKNAISFIKRLIVICSISILSMLIFLGIKLKLDIDYNENKFEQIYLEQNISEFSSAKSKFDIEINNKVEKKYYIDECIKLYNIFSLKAYGVLGIHLLLNILLIYEISKVLKIEDKKDRLNKDDLILYDEEINVKY